ncbi:MAG: hypothetical protein V9G12_24665 [Microthrixaceae bacterium]
MRVSRDRLVQLAPAVVLIVAAVVLPFVLPPFWVEKITGWIPLALAALGLNLLTGYNGQISVGHGALYGAGAYTAGLIITNWHWVVPRGDRGRSGGLLRPRCGDRRPRRFASRGSTWRW